MSYQHCRKAYVVVIAYFENSHNSGKEEHHRHTGYNIGVHHRNIGNRINSSLYNFASYSVDSLSSRSTDNGSEKRR